MKNRSNISICANLVKLVKPLTGVMILAVTFGVIGHLAAIFITVTGVYALLNLLGIGTAYKLSALFIAVGVMAVMRGVLHYLEQGCNHYIAFKLLALIRDKVFKALRVLCPAKLEGRDKGNLISVITSDIELLEVFYAHTISPIVIAFIVSIIMSVYLGSYNIYFGLFALFCYVVVGIIVPVIVSRKDGSDGRKFRERSGDLSSFVLESLRGLKEILQYDSGKKRISEMNKKTKRLSKVEGRQKNNAGKGMASTNTLVLILDISMLFIAGTLYTKNLVALDGVVVPVVALMSSFGPVIALANLGSTLSNTFAAGNRVLDILEESPVVEEVEGKEKTEFEGIKVEDVNFAYEDEQILDNYSVEIPKNKIVAIVGKSGSGKSTLLKLLMRFWDADEGRIEISGRDIKEINTSDLRKMEGYVTQETHLFHDSIKNNLLIAKQDATDEEIREACRKASVHDFIMTLPKGYDTPVGELGETLSGGERQRLGLARAFLHNAPVLLLDEPTSNLDSLNEAVILKAIHEEKENKTVILVSHRESTVGIADIVHKVETKRVS